MERLSENLGLLPAQNSVAHVQLVPRHVAVAQELKRAVAHENDAAHGLLSECDVERTQILKRFVANADHNDVFSVAAPHVIYDLVEVGLNSDARRERIGDDHVRMLCEDFVHAYTTLFYKA